LQNPIKLSIISMPEKVRAGEVINLEVKAEIVDDKATLGFVFLNVPDLGETFRFAKKSADVYTLGFEVPYIAPAGKYSGQLYATLDNGARTPYEVISVVVE